MTAFTCNICGAFNQVADFRTEPPSCACGSNVRLRALMHLLSTELFGRSLTITEFPKLKAVRAVGMTDQECYARILADRFDYVNTHYDREPRLDFTEPHPQLAGGYDFILSADVLEHIAPPVERALEEACRLLKPYGFLLVTVYCHPSDRMREHFPELWEYRIVLIGDRPVLINRRRDGALEMREDLIFHGGSGATLEMREFGVTALRAKLLGAGFQSVQLLTENLPEIGVLFDHDVSQPLIARKEPFVLDPAARSQLVDAWRAAEQEVRAHQERAESLQTQVRLASQSKWVRLGRRFGLGPRLG
jgi:SAM-dependent methyltransferase